MNDIIHPTPQEVERFTGEHQAISELVHYYCLTGQHDTCYEVVFVHDQERPGFMKMELCQCPCHQEEER